MYTDISTEPKDIEDNVVLWSITLIIFWDITQKLTAFPGQQGASPWLWSTDHLNQNWYPLMKGFPMRSQWWTCDHHMSMQPQTSMVVMHLYVSILNYWLHKLIKIYYWGDSIPIKGQDLAYTLRVSDKLRENEWVYLVHHGVAPETATWVCVCSSWGTVYITLKSPESIHLPDPLLTTLYIQLHVTSSELLFNIFKAITGQNKWLQVK